MLVLRHVVSSEVAVSGFKLLRYAWPSQNHVILGGITLEKLVALMGFSPKTVTTPGSRCALGAINRRMEGAPKTA